MPESLLTKALAHLRANAVDGVFSASMASVAEAIGCIEQVASDILGHMRDHGNLEYVSRGYIGRPGKFRILDGADTEWMDRTIVWDDVTISQISTLWVQGLTASEIGARLGITKNAVIGKSRRLGLSGAGIANHSDPPVRRSPTSPSDTSARLASNDQRQRNQPSAPPSRRVTTRDMRSRSSRHGQPSVSPQSFASGPRSARRCRS